MFLYFICIAFPEDKVTQILTKLSEEQSVNVKHLEKLKSSLYLRKGKTKKDINNFMSVNPCFALYANYIIKQLDTRDF